MPKHVAIFDMDGLFVDSEQIYAEGWTKGFKDYGIRVPEGFVESLAGQSAKLNDTKVVELVKSAELAKKIRAVREQYYQDKLQNGEIKLKRFAKDLAENLKKKGFKVILASSSTKQRIDELLSKNNAAHLFDAIVCTDHVKKPKPDPDIYYATLACFDTKPEDAIAFEDTIIGATAASEAGVDVCLVSEKLFREQTKLEHERCLDVFNDLEQVYKYMEANRLC